MNKYDETQCIRDLNKKRDCRISGNLIEVSKDNGDVGKKSWAKIDYLCKVHGYRYMIVAFSGIATKKNRKKYNEDYEETKPTSKKGKLNLHSMVKNIMNF